MISARNSTIAGSCINRRKGPSSAVSQKAADSFNNGGSEGDQTSAHRIPILKDIWLVVSIYG